MVQLIHIYHVWLHSYYIVIQPYRLFHFQPVLSLEINDLGMSLVFIPMA